MSLDLSGYILSVVLVVCIEWVGAGAISRLPGSLCEIYWLAILLKLSWTKTGASKACLWCVHSSPSASEVGAESLSRCFSYCDNSLWSTAPAKPGRDTVRCPSPSDGLVLLQHTSSALQRLLTELLNCTEMKSTQQKGVLNAIVLDS